MMASRNLLLGALLLVSFACGQVKEQPTPEQAAVAQETDASCVLEAEPRVLERQGSAVLLVWELEPRAIWSEAVLPEAEALATYRQAIIDADAVQFRPTADPPDIRTDEEREIWRREFANVDLAYGGTAGTIRPIRCLEALFFAYQTARFPELTHPTEFIVSVTRREVEGRTEVKAYFSGSDELFPPKALYGFDRAEQDVADGWEFWFVLHNHTVQTNQGRPALGTPVPSASDVDLSRSLAEELGLQSIRVTNGFFTIDIPAPALAMYEGR
jgi:hypothetical protein